MVDPRSSGSEPRRYFEDGRYRVSPHNYEPEVQSSFEFPSPLTIVDSTLRKMIMTSGIRPTVKDLLRVAEAIRELGIREEALNVSWWGDTEPTGPEYELCKALLATDIDLHVTVYADALLPMPYQAMSDRMSMRRAVDLLSKTGVDTITIPLGDPGADGRAEQSDRLAECAAYAKTAGMSVEATFFDAGRRDFEYLVRTANEALGLGISRITLQDTFGSLSPEGMKHFVRRVRSRLERDVPMTVHVHDDLGLASALTMAAATAGVQPDVSVNGISYRAGHARLEEVVLGLEILYGVQTGVRLELLKEVSDLVASLTFPNHPLKPITGANAFVRDLPVWMIGLIHSGTEGYPPDAPSVYAPSLVGGRMTLVWSFRHSNFLVEEKLKHMGLPASAEDVSEVRRRIQGDLDSKIEYPIWLSDEEVEAICHTVVGNGKAGEASPADAG